MIYDDVDKGQLYYCLKEAVYEEIYSGKDICKGRLLNEDEIVQFKVEVIFKCFRKATCTSKRVSYALSV